ncbi:nitroreductase family protein [Marinomonas epiphytica]
MNTVLTLIQNRKTTGLFDPSFDMQESEIKDIANYGFQAPTAYNLQNWQVIALSSMEAKAKACEAAYGQNQIKDASVTYLICGDLNGYQHLDTILQRDVDEKVVPENIKTIWVNMAQSSHSNSAQLRRDEAVRSGSLLAMNLVYAAAAKGYDTGTVGGFDAERLMQEFNLADDLIPVLMVTVGKAGQGNWKKKTRRPTEEVFQII